MPAENSCKIRLMKKVMVVLCLILCMGTLSAFSQNVILLGDKLLTANNMERVSRIISNGGMTIEPVEELLGINPDLRITATNGSKAQIPIICTVHAVSKRDRHIKLVSFVYQGDYRKLNPKLSNLGYKFVDEFEADRYGATMHCKRYMKGNKICVISYPTSGDKVSSIDFLLR